MTNIRKTILGETTFAALFEELRFCKTTFSKQHGSVTAAPPGFLFIALSGGASFRNKDRYGDCVIYAKPSQQVIDCTKDHLFNGLRSFEILPWVHEQKALVVGRDSSGIGSPWIGFIPLSEIPTVESLKDLPLP